MGTCSEVAPSLGPSGGGAERGAPELPAVATAPSVSPPSTSPVAWGLRHPTNVPANRTRRGPAVTRKAMRFRDIRNSFPDRGSRLAAGGPARARLLPYSAGGRQHFPLALHAKGGTLLCRGLVFDARISLDQVDCGCRRGFALAGGRRGFAREAGWLAPLDDAEHLAG